MKSPASHQYKIAILLSVILILSLRSISQSTIIATGSTWKYWSNTLANFPSGWQGTGFDDSGWPSAATELGYGDGDEATCIPAGGSGGTTCLPTGNKWVTAYFRKKITIANPSLYSSFTFNVERDDGCVVYLNGVEVGRDNMPGTAVTWSTGATTPIEDGVYTVTVPASSFATGDNYIAVEVHQASVSGSPATSSSSDLSFNLELLANDLFTASLSRGPYLQMANQTAITIRWRTSSASDSKVQIGTAFGTYGTTVSNGTSVTEHIIRVTGLTADTKYWYIIGNSTNMGSPDPEKFFTTVPPANTTRKIKIVAFGDCGRGDVTYQDQNLSNYKSYLTTNGIDAPDAWLVLGDNAYTAGTDADYTNNFFGIYGSSVLKNHKLYPAPGNHDYGNNTANKASRVMPYYNNFTTPQLGECGGVASNHPNFYSYDIGNIHFLSLDSWGIESDGSYMGQAVSQVKSWVTADLAANTKKWIIAYWHHGGYTKGSHDSDGEAELGEIRQNFDAFLESKGVDLVICGHSHVYERSYLLKGLTGAWTSFVAGTNAVSTSSAAYTSAATCPYVYPSSPANHGTVYITAGSTGASTGSTYANFNMYAFPYSVNDGGVFYFEVDGNRLDAKMLRRNGTVFDNFTIIKDVNTTNSQSVVVGTPVTLNASWPGNYNWNTSATTRAINFTPAVAGTTNFTVTDNFGCITDQFSVTANSILPVSLVDYDVALKDGKVNVSWSTSSEMNSKFFTVERTQNQANFELVGRVNAAGQTTEDKNYRLTDAHPLPGVSYYRLSQTDIDGKIAYYDLKKIIVNVPVFSARQFSAENGQLVLQLNSPKNDKVSIKVYDLSGKEVWHGDMNMNAGTVQKTITLQSGSYVWSVINGSGESVSKIAFIK